mmetsp:Transcript_44829/g.70988  ORF Transcript_44829/g.70988 Transcript_44829/m.70988 type:complete len:91 (+) Transcript_44829:2-274(+)
MLQFTEMANLTESMAAQDPMAVEDLLSWSTEEELLVVRQELQLAGRTGSIRSSLQGFMMVAAAASLALGLVKSVRSSEKADMLEYGKIVV